MSVCSFFSVCSLISRGANIFISLSSCQTTIAIHNVLLPHNVPVLYFEGCPGHSAYDSATMLVPLVQPLHDVSEVVTSIFTRERWKDVVVFYDNDHGKNLNVFVVCTLSLALSID